MYIGVMIVLEGYRDGGILVEVELNVLYALAFGFHSTKVKNILYKDWYMFQLWASRLQ